MPIITEFRGVRQEDIGQPGYIGSSGQPGLFYKIWDGGGTEQNLDSTLDFGTGCVTLNTLVQTPHLCSENLPHQSPQPSVTVTHGYRQHRLMDVDEGKGLG